MLWTLNNWLYVFAQPMYMAGGDGGGGSSDGDDGNGNDGDDGGEGGSGDEGSQAKDRGDSVSSDDGSDDGSAAGKDGKDGEEGSDGDGGASDGGDKGDGEEHMLPKSRYDYQARRARRAEERASELERKLAELEKGDSGKSGKDTGADSGKIDSIDSLNERLSEIDKEIEKARADNDMDKVIQLNKQQREAEHEYYQSVINERTENLSKSTREEVRLDQVITVLEERYPALNPDGKDYDQDVVDEVLDLKEALISRDYAPADAMLAAVNYVIGDGDVGDVGADDGKDGQSEADRRAAAIDKNLDTANRQPGSKGKGMDSDKGGMGKKPNVLKLTEEEFEKLPEEEKRRARGDFIDSE